MFYKFSALIVVLAVCAGSLVADDKDKKDAKKEAIKGSVSKFDQAKHSVTLKTADGEKDYSLAEEVVIVYSTGQKVTASQKPAASTGKEVAAKPTNRALMFVLRTGNEVEVVFADVDKKMVKEIHFDLKRPASPAQRKPAEPPVGTKKNVPDDAPKKDDGKN
jgi:ribosomal protein S1